MRESCERREAALAADDEAYICSHECTFYGECLEALEQRARTAAAS
jgi:hypothetical protein